MEREYKFGIGWARFLAMLCIISCHVLQAQDNQLCLVLNVGVPVFLFLSGYLYGGKRIENIPKFYITRAIRILIPYYLMLLVILLVNVIRGISFSPKELLSMLLCQQWYGTTVAKSGHLWYISCILFCYLITPLLESIAQKTKNISHIKLCVLLCTGAVLLQLIRSLGGISQNVYSIVPYIAGYFWSYRLQTAHCRKKNGLWTALACGCLIGLIAKYLLETKGFSVPGILYEYYKSVSGIVFALFCINVLDRKNVFAQKFLKLSDRYSYAVYLSHHIYILGALSVMNLTKYLWLNIMLALMLTLVTAVLLHELSEKIRKIIPGKGC